MQNLLKNSIKFLPVATVIFLLLFIQLLFISTNILGVILFARLLIYRETYKIVGAALITSLIYDSVKMIPLGSWSMTFFGIALLVIGIVVTMKLSGTNELESWPTVFIVLLCTICAATLQSYLLMRISGQTKFDIRTLYSIVALSTLYIVFQKLTYKKERRLLLD